MEDISDDPRLAELDTLEAIFPEIRRSVGADSYCFDIDLPVQPTTPVTVTFPAALGNDPGNSVEDGISEVESLQVAHLPSLSVQVSLPPGYPSDRPPVVRIVTNPQWLPESTIDRLADDGPRLWEEAGRDMVAYAFLDHIQRASEDVFGSLAEDGTLQIDPEHKVAVLDHDIKAKKEAFERETFDCGVCLDPKKGSQCYKMLDCGHIFCTRCLQDFYNDAIEQGSLSSVRCLSPNCAKDRAAKQRKRTAADGTRHGRAKVRTFVSPSELLQIGLSEEMVKRYVSLKHKMELESDKSTVYCPRQWCNGAARSKKHKKPLGLEFEEDSDQDTDVDDETSGIEEETNSKPKMPKFDPADLLAVCEDCGLAFCRRCCQPWHGEFVRCTPKRRTEELTEEEKASLEYLRLHTSPCPTCAAPAQKTHGCNHMICARCETHFCYLCFSWLDPSNPYRHYNQQQDGKVTSCYMRLWELEEGDGDDVGLGFGGGGGGGVIPFPPPLEEEAPEADNVGDDDIDEFNGADNRPPPQGHRDAQGALHAPPQPVVAREAPLVLRLHPIPPVERPPQPEARLAPPPAGNTRGRGRGRGGRAGGGARGGRGRGGRGRAAGEGGGGGEWPGLRRGRQQGNGAAAAVPNPVPQQQRGRIHGAEPNNNDQGVVNVEAAAAAAMGEAPAGLDAAQEAWIRHFVELALMDAEDLVEDGSSDDDFDFNGFAFH